jgi:hypothetical protein
MSEQVLAYQSPVPRRETTREIFGLIVRTTGLLASLYGLSNVAYAVAEATSFRIPVVYGVSGVIFVGAGIAMVRGEWIVRFAYGRNP